MLGHNMLLMTKMNKFGDLRWTNTVSKIRNMVHHTDNQFSVIGCTIVDIDATLKLAPLSYMTTKMYRYGQINAKGDIKKPIKTFDCILVN